LPVLILSALSSEKDTLEGLQKGAVDYVSKPFSINVLIQKAKRLMGSS
ncbi:MAG: Response regulator receiver domain, partial [Chlamydiota bacterium]